MKKIIAMLLALVLAFGMLAMTVSAEEIKGESDPVEAPVVTTGEGELVAGERDVITVYGEGELVEGERETVTVYGEEKSGFFGWLKNLWNAILRFFGL